MVGAMRGYRVSKSLILLRHVRPRNSTPLLATVITQFAKCDIILQNVTLRLPNDLVTRIGQMTINSILTRSVTNMGLKEK